MHSLGLDVGPRRQHWLSTQHTVEETVGTHWALGKACWEEFFRARGRGGVLEVLTLRPGRPGFES